MYILGKEKQQAVLKSLELISETEEGWTHQYRDTLSGQEWIFFHVHPEYHGGGIPVLRQDPPPAEINSWLELCFGTGSEDDVVGLGLELSNQHESWLLVIEWLESKYSRYSKESITSFIYQLGVRHPTNRRDPLGKSPDEVEEDYQHFVDLAERANCLVSSF